MKKHVNIIGAGLSGSEAALCLANFGFQVSLYEMRPGKSTPAHKTPYCAELVCSNSFGSLNEFSAPGQLKWEAEVLKSPLLRLAKKFSVPAGQALGIDRELFAEAVTQEIKNHPLIKLIPEEVLTLDQLVGPTIVASGPLTSDALMNSLSNHFEPLLGASPLLYFFDAIAPVIATDSIDLNIAWKADRYDKGTPDYINCPLEKKEYYDLMDAIEKARKIEPKHFEITPFFEGCMPIEVMVERGRNTLRFGPMKPVGLINPRTGKIPYAVVQLRQDNTLATAYNMVGFQTRMAYGDQKEVFRMIPGLHEAEFLKLGSIHRNLFINTPTLLNADLSSRLRPDLYFIGQITGVEGYFESISMGHLVARRIALGQGAPPPETAMGSLLRAITDPLKQKHFQPTNINFGLFPPLSESVKDKAEKKEKQIRLAQGAFLSWCKESRPMELALI